MEVIGVDAGDVRVGHDYEGKIAEGADPVGEADWNEGAGEVGGGEEGVSG